MAPIPKPRELRQRARTHTRPELSALPPRSIVGNPDPPKGLLKASRETWRAYWESPVAAAALPVDVAGLERWIIAVDQWNRATRELRKNLYSTGSTGQTRLAPAAAYAKQLERQIEIAEDRYGMTPMSRLKLGISTAQARMSAAQLNASLAADANNPPPTADPFLAEYEEAN